MRAIRMVGAVLVTGALGGCVSAALPSGTMVSGPPPVYGPPPVFYGPPPPPPPPRCFIRETFYGPERVCGGGYY